MGIFRARFISNLTQQGQSTVEYILLFAVVIALVSLVFQSSEFKNLFGKNGKFSDKFRREMEYSYRHGLSGDKPFKEPQYKERVHDSYNGRFFGARDAYPGQ